MSDQSHPETAAELVADVRAEASWSVTDRIALAQVHATLAVAEAISSWQPPGDDEADDEEPMTSEEFADRWR